jgi:cell wall-associated NlpC family hydrolase
MQRLYYLSLLAASPLLLVAQPPLQCDLHIAIDQAVPSEIRITLEHNPRCKVTMDEKHSRFLVRAADKTSSAKKSSAGKSSDKKPRETKTTPTSTRTKKIIALAQSKLGKRYQPAKAGPDRFDCSGFVYYVFTQNGITIPRSSLPQSKAGKRLTRKELKEGDILFFDTANRKHVNHSGIYLGKGKFIHSSSGRAYGVTVSDLDTGFYKDKFRWGIRKIDTH